MPKRAFKVGDKVTVIGSPPIPRDQMDTKKLFKSMVGKAYTVRGYDGCGNVELRPNRLNVVWIEQEFVKLRARKRKKP
ncbi:MAG: hypothetical protein WAL95_11340 [Candidatus Acidiferrales bacterium]